MKKVTLVLLAIVSLTIFAGGCSVEEGKSANEKAKEEVTKSSEKRAPYIPKNDVEFDNYNNAQKLYDSPDTIIWCSVMPQASSAPILTVPITGKLTSSSTTYFRPEEGVDFDDGLDAVVGAKSVDGMYHPNPPQYRFGFTPGGQYVDFFQLPTFCTTKPLDFQKDSVAIKVDNSLNAATLKAEEALRNGDSAAAQAALEAVASE